MKLKSFLALLALVVTSSQVFAQEETTCGEPPVEPSIVYGATSTMEQLVANSSDVNAFIAAADDYLDCSEARYKQLSSSKVHRDDMAELIKAITARRNEIGDEFNEQIAAYRAANPDS